MPLENVLKVDLSDEAIAARYGRASREAIRAAFRDGLYAAMVAIREEDIPDVQEQDPEAKTAPKIVAAHRRQRSEQLSNAAILVQNLAESVPVSLQLGPSDAVIKT